MKMRTRGSLAALVAVWGVASMLGMGIAQADEDDERYTRVSLHAEESREVANDWIVAHLAVEYEDRRPADLAQRVNQTMSWALGLARGSEGVRMESGAYSTNPVWQEGRIHRWRAFQGLRLESGDPDAITSLIGELQAQLHLKSMEFTIAPQTRKRAENELIDAALNVFRTRAEIVRANFDAGAYKVKEMSIRTDGSQLPPIPMARGRMALAESKSRPAVEAGRSEVRVTVNGTIELH